MFGALAQQQANDAAVFASATPQERTVAAQMAAIAQIAAQQQQHQQHQMQQQFSQQQHFMGPPPGTGMHQTPMPPRPRPEGGLEGEHQDGGSYHRPNKNNSDHLVIDSWTDEDNEKAQATQQHMGLMPPNSSASSYDKNPRDE